MRVTEQDSPAGNLAVGIPLPELLMPFAEALNPHADEVQRRSAERWAARLGRPPSDEVVRRLDAIRLAMLMGRAYPTASFDDLDLITDYGSWSFLWDDLCDNGNDPGAEIRPEQVEAFNRRAQRILLGGAPLPDDGPLLTGLWEILARLRARMPGYWVQRFASSNQGYLEACDWQAMYAARRRTPDVDTYLRIRRFDVGAYAVIDLIEMAEGFTLPQHVRFAPHLRAMVDATADVLALSNDIFSLRKELYTGSRHNVVIVLQDALACSIEEALRRAADMHDARMRDYLDLEHTRPSFGPAHDAHIERLSAGLRAWMRANVDWSFLTGRYRSHPDRAKGQLQGASSALNG